MFGFRPDGRRVKDMDPIIAVTPYIMPMRCDAQVFLDYEIDYEPAVRFIAEKGRQGVKITFMELLIAAYVRTVSQLPEVNRFIINKQFFDRHELSVAFTILMNTADGSIMENVCKVSFDPTDTIYEVAARVAAVIEQNRKPEESGAAIKIATYAMKLPFLPTFVMLLLKGLDRYGLAPKSLLDALPFHVSTYITNMASIGMGKVYHHIYNFGSVGQFFSIGNMNRSNTVDAKGNVIRKCTLPIGVTADERLCAGAIYAKMFASMKHLLLNPAELETPPEKVNYGTGKPYHVEKPQNVVLPR